MTPAPAHFVHQDLDAHKAGKVANAVSSAGSSAGDANSSVALDMAPASAVLEGRVQQTSSSSSSSSSSRVQWWLDRTLMPLVVIPILAVWYILAFLLAWLATFMVWPSLLLAQRLYWACPFGPYIFRALPMPKGWLLRIGFEASYCINVVTRFLTLPMRRTLPNFYIVGFPKCGTTSLAEHLKRHPAISPPAGLPFHEALSKETHFFEGVLGRSAAHQRSLYRSFFPTTMRRWWQEVVVGAGKWMCFDACPVHACLPYVARRIAALTPDAKIILMLRDPVEGVYSGEVMLQDMGMPLGWQSLSQEYTGPGVDPRFVPPAKEEVELWTRIAHLGPQATLPAEMPHALYCTLGGVLRCGQYVDLIQPYLQCFPPENLMIVNFNDFKSRPDAVVQDVLQFVGADPGLYEYKPLPPAMANKYGGRKLHPQVASRLAALYRPGIRRLEALLQRDMGWGHVSRDAGGAAGWVAAGRGEEGRSRGEEGQEQQDA